MQKKDISIKVKTANEKKPEERRFKCVEYVDDIDNPKDLLNYLDRTDDRWGTGLKSPWIFRGQGNAAWGLTPKAWRKEAYSLLRPIMISFEPVAKKKFTGTEHDNNRIAIEVLTHTGAVFELTYQFSELADKLGFEMPGMYDIISGVEFINTGRWPSHWLIPGDKPSQAFGLAQHHGIPTQFLDWTRNSLFAAFFAGVSYRREASKGEWTADGSPHETPERLAVWAINLNLINTNPRDSNALSPFSCPRSKHSFLHAQDALFLWHSRGDSFRLQNDHWPDFLEVVEADYSEGQPKPLKRISLAGTTVDRLLFLLYRLGVSKAHLMPTYDNIAKTVRDDFFINALDQLLSNLTETISGS